MSGLVERLRQAVSGVNRETLVQVASQWRGRGVELLARLSAQMSQSPLKAFAVIVVVNGLFYTLISRHVVNRLDHCTKRSDRAQPNTWVGVVVLGSLTALINIGFSKLVQTPLSRVALLAITSSVVVLRLLFNLDLSALPARRNADRTGSVQRLGQHNPSSETASAASKPVPNLSASNLKNFGYTDDDINLFAKYIGYPEALSRLDAFIQSIPTQAKALLSTSLEKRQLILSIVSDFQRMRGSCSTSPLCLEQVLKRISNEIFNKQSVSLSSGEFVQWLIDRNLTRFQLANLVAAVGQEHRTDVLHRLRQFLENLHEINDARASNMNAAIMNSLFQRIINRFCELKTNSQPADFDALDTLDRLFEMYARRFQNNKYHVFIECSSQDNIDCLLNFFSEYAQHPASVQDTILDDFEQSLLPLLTKSLSENRQLLSQIIDDFNVAKRGQKLTRMDAALRLFDEVCVKHRPLEANENYQALVKSGFDGTHLTTLVASIGNDHRTKIMNKLVQFVRGCLTTRGSTALAIVEERKNYILESMINDINSLKTSSHPSHADSLQTFDKILDMYGRRFQSMQYRALIERTYQGYIDALARLFSQYAENFQYFQDRILDDFEQHLLPLLSKSVQENNQLIAQILEDFNVSKRNRQFTSIFEPLVLLNQVCAKYRPLELDSNYQTLIGVGFDGAQLARLVASVGHDHRDQVMERLNRLVQECQNSEHQSAAAMIQDREKKNALLQSIINSFDVLKTSSSAADFNSLETLDQVCEMYKSRLKSEKYHLLLELCSQEQINHVADIFNEYIDKNYFYMDHYQLDIIDTLEQHLLPLLTKTFQENGAIVEQIQSDFDRLRRNQQLRSVSAAQRLFEIVCTEHCPLEANRHYRSLVAFGFDGSPLASLVASIGHDHRHQVMERLNRLVQECQNSEHQAAVAMIRDGEQTRALLQSMINSFNEIKASTSTTNFKSCETFDHVCSMYKGRLESEKYHLLVERCSQEQINHIADIFNEYNNRKYYYYDHNQRTILDTLEEHLLPFLTKTSQENGTIVEQIQSNFDRLRRTQQLDNVYAAGSLFEAICSRYRHYHELIEWGFSDSQLTALVGLVGNDCRDQVIKRLNQVFQVCQNSEHQTAATMIRAGERRGAFLQSMINSFNGISAGSPTTDFFETFDHVCSMYKGRLESEKYHLLVERCPQEQINIVADLLNENDIYYYMHQDTILNTLVNHLLPILTEISQEENKAIAEQILLNYYASRTGKQFGYNFEIRELFGQVCSNYRK